MSVYELYAILTPLTFQFRQKKKKKTKKNASSKYTYSVLFWLEDYLKQLRDLYLPGVCDLAMVSILDT